MRGPLAGPNRWVRHPASLVGARGPRAFDSAVQLAVALVQRHNPEALQGIRVAVADVPTVSPHQTGVPLAESVAATPDRPAHIVLYRRPLERRAANQAELQRLVAGRLVEQLSALTGLSITELAGDGFDLDY